MSFVDNLCKTKYRVRQDTYGNGSSTFLVEEKNFFFWTESVIWRGESMPFHSLEQAKAWIEARQIISVQRTRIHKA